MNPDTAHLIALYERLSTEQKAEVLNLLNGLLSGTRVSLPSIADKQRDFKPAPWKTGDFKGSTVLSDDFDEPLDFNTIPFDAPNLNPLFNRPYGKRKRWEPGELKGKFVMAPDFDEPLEDFKDYM